MVSQFYLPLTCFFLSFIDTQLHGKHQRSKKEESQWQNWVATACMGFDFEARKSIVTVVHEIEDRFQNVIEH